MDARACSWHGELVEPVTTGCTRATRHNVGCSRRRNGRSLFAPPGTPPDRRGGPTALLLPRPAPLLPPPAAGAGWARSRPPPRNRPRCFRDWDRPSARRRRRRRSATCVRGDAETWARRRPSSPIRSPPLPLRRPSLREKSSRRPNPRGPPPPRSGRRRRTCPGSSRG